MKQEKNEKRKKHEYWLNKAELEILDQRLKNSRHKSRGQYVRSLILEEGRKEAKHLNPVDFFKTITNISKEVNKVGNNINQLAKHANEMKKQHMLPSIIIDALEEKLDIYIHQQNELITKLKEVIKS